MKLPQTDSFTLSNFEGPLDLLWHLINREEIDIYEISLIEITKQYLSRTKEIENINIDQGAEFIAMAASLVWLKSKTLLPSHEQIEEVTEEEKNDPQFEIIHQLIDYCRFKKAAKELSQLEQQQSAYYSRGVESGDIKKNLGIDHLSLDDLASLFSQILAKASTQKGIIHEETWRVSDKIKLLRYLLIEHHTLPFETLFTSEKSREELIVTFLALLELMKLGEAKVIIDRSKNIICIQAPS